MQFAEIVALSIVDGEILMYEYEGASYPENGKPNVKSQGSWTLESSEIGTQQNIGSAVMSRKVVQQDCNICKNVRDDELYILWAIGQMAYPQTADKIKYHTARGHSAKLRMYVPVETEPVAETTQATTTNTATTTLPTTIKFNSINPQDSITEEPTTAYFDTTTVANKNVTVDDVQNGIEDLLNTTLNNITSGILEDLGNLLGTSATSTSTTTSTSSQPNITDTTVPTSTTPSHESATTPSSYFILAPCVCLIMLLNLF